MRLPGALAVIAIVAVGCGPQDPGTVEPAQAPTSARILTRADVPGAGWRTVAVPDRLGWSFALTDCPAYDARDYPAQSHRSEAQAASYTQGHGRTVQILIEAYADQWSSNAVADVSKVIEVCPRYQTEQALTSHTIEAQAYAGDESLLIRSDVIHGAEPAIQWWTAVIRKGSRVATVTGTNMTAAEVRRVATAQARRL